MAEIVDKLQASMQASLSEALPQLEPKMVALKEAVEAPSRQMSSVIEILSDAETQLKQLAKSLTPI